MNITPIIYDASSGGMGEKIRIIRADGIMSGDPDKMLVRQLNFHAVVLRPNAMEEYHHPQASSGVHRARMYTDQAFRTDGVNVVADRVLIQEQRIDRLGLIVSCYVVTGIGFMTSNSPGYETDILGMLQTVDLMLELDPPTWVTIPSHL